MAHAESGGERPFMAFTRFLADDSGGDDILRALVLGPMRDYPIRAATLSVVDHENHQLVQMGTYGVDDPIGDMFRVMPLERSYPDGAVVADGAALHMSLVDVAVRFPLVSRFVEMLRYVRTGSIRVVPIVSRAVTIGTLFLMSDALLPESWEFHEYSVTLAQSLAPWARARQSAGSHHDGGHGFFFRVSQRERDVVTLVGEGKTNGEIARQLGYSEPTIRADLLRLSKMLGVSGRRAIHARLAEIGLLDG